MTTKSVSLETTEKTERVPRNVPRQVTRAHPLSARARIANRDWYPGLCTTCVHESECTFPRSVESPVRSCDEFEGVVGVQAPAAVARERISGRFAVANREWFPGLCLTCEKRESCVFPKPEGGVFNCDEFE